MPELPPKRSGDIASFDRLSRLIGDGSLRPHGDKPARKIPSSRGIGSDPISGYAELQVASNFSFLRGASHPDELVVAAAALGHAAVAITDRNSFAGIVRAHHAAKTIGIRLVIGARLDYADLVAHGEGQIVVALSPELAPRLAADFAGRAYLAAHHLYRGDDAQ